MTDTSSGAVRGEDGLMRCPWGAHPQLYRDYHDHEWGRRLHGDDALFERLSLEGFQSGLSWLTILRKRAAFWEAFDGFSVARIVGYDDSDVQRLLDNPGIVRNRSKITAVIANAGVVADMDGSLSDLLWSYAPARRPRPQSVADVPATTPESAQLAKALKRQGFRFVGPTTVYALMQAVGMVDDHLATCHVAPAHDEMDT